MLSEELGIVFTGFNLLSDFGLDGFGFINFNDNSIFRGYLCFESCHLCHEGRYLAVCFFNSFVVCINLCLNIFNAFSLCFRDCFDQDAL